MTLQETNDSLQLPSDKGTEHSYLPLYQEWFGGIQDISLLEIGIKDGASIKLWREYFGPSAYVACADIRPSMTTDASRIYQMDSASRRLSGAIEDDGHTFNIIIDDGNHSIKSQLETFYSLRRFVKPGGIYIIEDLENVRRDEETLKSLGFTVHDRRDEKGRQDDILATWCS